MVLPQLKLFSLSSSPGRSEATIPKLSPFQTGVPLAESKLTLLTCKRLNCGRYGQIAHVVNLSHAYYPPSLPLKPGAGERREGDDEQSHLAAIYIRRRHRPAQHGFNETKASLEVTALLEHQSPR